MTVGRGISDAESGRTYSPKELRAALDAGHGDDTSDTMK
jgi:hypothetical protein